MLSRKNVRSGQIDFFLPADICEKAPTQGRTKKKHMVAETFAGQLDRGETILLLEDPVKVSSAPLRGRWGGASTTTTKLAFWKIRFLFSEKIYHMYLTKRQYGQELVKSVPRRLKKDYSPEVSK